MKQQYTSEQLVQRWEDRREVKNVMGKYVVSFLIKQEDKILDTLWSKADDICLGLNDGWFSGREALDGYYKSYVKRNIAVRDKLMALFPDQIKGATPEENYGIGVFDLRSISNCVVEIAGDGKTAKGMWALYGLPTDIDERGPVTYWSIGTLCADFIKEDDAWKLWHVQMLEDIHSPSGMNWSRNENPYPELADFADLKGINVPQPNVPATLREYYSINRPFTPLPKVPEAYDTFEETFSYGL